MSQRRILLVATLLLTLGIAGIALLPYQRNAPAAQAVDAGLAATPPMGWNSWNHFGCEITEWNIRDMADALVSSGMRDAGYTYVVVDDCWQVARAKDGTIIADPLRFPSGIKNLAEYVHARGLKFGLYTSAGNYTCQERPGSRGYEELDMATYAAWGVDYVKIDWCFTDGLDARTAYVRYRDAITKTGRPMLLSICEWGENRPWEWGRGVGHLWRVTGDIRDRWSAVLRIMDQAAPLAEFAAPGGWNDLDMLEVGNGGMRENEYRAHFSLWAIMNSPLIAGNDLTEMDAATRRILLNTEVIAINQDQLGAPGRRIRVDDQNRMVWAKPLAEPNSVAVLLFNRSTNNTHTISVSWSELGLTAGPAQVRDVWAHADLGEFSGGFSAQVPPRDVVMLRITTSQPNPAPTPLPQPAPQPLPDPSSGDLVRPALERGARTIGWTPLLGGVNGYGPAEVNMSNGEDAPGDGHPITLNGVIYAEGLGVHAPSDMRFALGGTCSTFSADIGVDDEVGANGSVVFLVLVDGQVVFDSGPMTGNTATRRIELDVRGVQELGLLVTDAGDNTYFDHADWAGARLVCTP